jgi:hypothetical protein
MKMRNHVLTSMLRPMVQRKDFSPLVNSLPPKFEFTLSIRLSDLQVTSPLLFAVSSCACCLQTCTQTCTLSSLYRPAHPLTLRRR